MVKKRPAAILRVSLDLSRRSVGRLAKITTVR
jgi:hypothetical protein